MLEIERAMATLVTQVDFGGKLVLVSPQAEQLSVYFGERKSIVLHLLEEPVEGRTIEG